MEGHDPVYCDDAVWVHGIPICTIMELPCWKVQPCAKVQEAELTKLLAECMTTKEANQDEAADDKEERERILADRTEG